MSIDPELVGETREVRAKLAVVEEALMSHTVPVPVPEEERRERLRKRMGQNQWLPLYLNYSSKELKKEKLLLQQKELLLQQKELLLLQKEEREGECLCLPLGVWLRAGCCSA
jgi:hypothetical protein